ncbi:DUF2087 domain-containing protein [bacterium]|nr:DUF2087 domain-containing protein [bacterium]
MDTQKTIILLKALSDSSRLLILNALNEKDQYVEELSQRLNLAASTISFHLKKLEMAELISSSKEQYYTMYSMNRKLLDKKLSEILFVDDLCLDEQERRVKMYRDKVISSFFKYGKLEKIPVQRKKKRIILEELVKKFEFDRIYKEKEVNIIIAEFNDDFCTIRRDFISEKLMKRDKGLYERIWKES